MAITVSDSTTTVLSTLNGMFKDQFADKIDQLLPDHTILQKDGFIEWVAADKQPGELLSIPTVVRSNQGVTYLGESGGIIPLKDARPGQTVEAQIKGNEMVLRGQLSYAVLARSAKSSQAFKKASAHLVEDLTQVHATRLEISALYGQDNLAVVSGVSGSGPWTVTCTADSFAPGMFALLEGATVEIWAAGGTQRGTNAVFSIDAVNTNNRTITLSVASGTYTTGIAATDTIHFEGARTGASSYKEMAGLKKQLSAVSGTLFNIDRSAYALTRGNPVDLASAPLTKAKLLEVVMKAVDKGCMSKLTVLVGTGTFADLHEEFLSLQRFEGASFPEKVTAGAEKIAYRSVNGPIEVICHPLVKPGDAFIFNPEEVVWVGSRKPGFEIPGTDKEFFKTLDGYNAVELQSYSDMSIYVHKPARTVMVTGISNA